MQNPKLTKTTLYKYIWMTPYLDAYVWKPWYSKIKAKPCIALKALFYSAANLVLCVHVATWWREQVMWVTHIITLRFMFVVNYMHVWVQMGVAVCVVVRCICYQQKVCAWCTWLCQLWRPVCQCREGHDTSYWRLRQVGK